MSDSNTINANHLKAKIAKMTAEEIIAMNKRALATLLFIYADGWLEFSNRDIKQYPSLEQQNRVVHGSVGDYTVLDLLRLHGYVEGESNRNSRWHKIFLTEKGLSKATQLHSNFIKNNYEDLFG